jgi:hypothetical protein
LSMKLAAIVADRCPVICQPSVIENLPFRLSSKNHESLRQLWGFGLGVPSPHPTQARCENRMLSRNCVWEMMFRNNMLLENMLLRNVKIERCCYWEIWRSKGVAIGKA